MVFEAPLQSIADVSDLVEREVQLSILDNLVAEPVDSGSVVLLSGEAGFGKTSLLNRFTSKLDHRYTVLWASCEPIGVPAAFAPLYDLLDALPDRLRDDVLSSAGRPAVNAGMLDLLKNDRAVLILEDMHWADEATLGLARYLGTRIAPTRSSLIITYRSEEVDPTHPLRLVTADLGRAAVRIELPALSEDGVRQMVSGEGLDPGKIHAATLGNPFFVEQLIRQPDLELPPSIEDAILASVSRLPPDTHEMLHMVALSPDGLPLDLVLSQGPTDGLDLAIRRRILESSGGQVRCRHDLIRETLERSIPPALARSLHLRVLDALEESDGPVDVTKLAHHSVGAGDGERAVRYSLRAAREAAQGGAHRQAAAHYSNALGFRSSMERPTLLDTLLAAAREQCLINEFDIATEFAGERVALFDDSVEVSRARAWLAYFESRKNHMEAAKSNAHAALVGLAGLRQSEERALALTVLAWVATMEAEFAESVDYGEQAIAEARAANSIDVEVHAATMTGGARCALGDISGLAQMEKAAATAIAEECVETAAQALNWLAWTSYWGLRLDESRRWLEKQIEYTAPRELDAWYISGMTTLASIDVASGRWAEAEVGIEVLLGQRTCLMTEVEALSTAGQLRARQGHPDALGLIAEALDRVGEGATFGSRATVTALALEGAWLGLIGVETAAALYEELCASPMLSHDPYGRARVAFWAHRLGLDPPGGVIPGAIGLELEGRSAEAAEKWERLGFPVENALTKAGLPDADLDSIFSELARLGADGVARALRRDLQRSGVKGVPRGERSATRENPARLTTRQAEVLTLIATGLSNADIAEELFISEKTAGHHVSAVLTKLNVSSRLQAAAWATANGWGVAGSNGGDESPVDNGDKSLQTRD